MIVTKQFTEVIGLIKQARYRAFKAVNTELINLYWEIGRYIADRTEQEGWGKGTVQQLADYIGRTEPELKGFSDKNLWRMKQFYQTYRGDEKLSPLLRELSWTHNLIIFSRCQSQEERAYYLQKCKGEKWSKRELERQIQVADFERTMLSNKKLSPLVREITGPLESFFKETYVLEFLNLPENHTEDDLKKQLLARMRQFIAELGKDFLFMGEEYRLQVGNKDFRTDLLFYHRGLQCLVCFELKTTDFEPEYLGKLGFYLEALDRDVKKPHERPSIGVLLCKGKDADVVEYAMNRQLSPALIAEYTLALPDKQLLQQKLHEFYEQWKEKEGRE